ncbi:hypothetical protein J6590_042137 [Homalodisca vitripennis]|nr:hypothetical protein J6590_042137 [Homalodisca vitripennis]
MALKNAATFCRHFVFEKKRDFDLEVEGFFFNVRHGTALCTSFTFSTTHSTSTAGHQSSTRQAPPSTTPPRPTTAQALVTRGSLRSHYDIYAHFIPVRLQFLISSSLY